MILYHGSNVTVEQPKILTALRALDFGAGFYMTSSREQAVKWAKSVTRRRGNGQPTLNIYEFNNSNYIKVLCFETADDEWLVFVVRNRRNIHYEYKYDLVIGPIANDTTLRVIDDYMDGIYTKDEAVKRLLQQRFTDQYAFLTEQAISLLRYKECEIYEQS